MTINETNQRIQAQLDSLEDISKKVDALIPDPNQYSTISVKYSDSDIRPIQRQYKSWRTITLALLQSCLGEDDVIVKKFDRTVTYNMAGFDYKREYQNNIDEGRTVLESILTTLKLSLGVPINPNPDGNSPTAGFRGQLPTSIFIVHGHDNALKQEVARTLERLGLKPIILHEQANHGQTIIEKFEEYANVGFAIILYTQCDLGIAKRDYTNGAILKPRARQNVIFEHGYFIAKPGRNRVMAILDEGVEKPGDLDGIVYTPKSHWRGELVRELKAVGYDIDANKLYD